MTPCIHFEGYKNRGGYGVINGKLAHRLAYEAAREPIPDGMQIDHLCRTRDCVNPDHMEVVTLQENVRRGFSPSAVNARRTHCKHGHPLRGENLYRYCYRGSWRRQCYKCLYTRAKNAYIPVSER